MMLEGGYEVIFCICMHECVYCFVLIFYIIYFIKIKYIDKNQNTDHEGVNMVSDMVSEIFPVKKIALTYF